MPFFERKNYSSKFIVCHFAKIYRVISNQNALIIFIQNPEIVANSSNKTVINAHNDLLGRTLEIVTNVNCKKYVYYSGKIIKKDIWAQTIFVKKQQKGNDLGERMLNAFTEVFAIEGIKNVAIIGSNCPSLPPNFIHFAFEELKHNSFVIGPTYNGSYYLLAMRALRYELFEKIVWSGQLVFSETIKKINKMVKTHYLLPALPTIDSIIE